MIDRTHRELKEDDIQKITDTYHAWRGDANPDSEIQKYEDIAGFCKSASLEEIRKHNHILTPGRYVGVEEIEDDGEPFEEKMERLTKQLSQQFKESRRLEEQIKANLKEFWYE